MESLENIEIPDVNSKLEEIEREVHRIEEEITEVRHVTSLSYEGMIDQRSCAHNLSSYEIKAWIFFQALISQPNFVDQKLALTFLLFLFSLKIFKA